MISGFLKHVQLTGNKHNTSDSHRENSYNASGYISYLFLLLFGSDLFSCTEVPGINQS